MQILYIEDTPSNIHVIERIAAARGYQLLVALTGTDGLLLARKQPDLILIDISLPDIDGLTVAQQIRSFLPETPIIALTAHALLDDRAKCLAAGCTDYLAKPYRIAALVELLQRYETVLGS